jgi:hypothetical protein
MLCLKYLGLINFKEIKFMKIDILSDLDLDFYFKPHLTTEENVVSFFEPIFTELSTLYRIKEFNFHYLNVQPHAFLA